MYDLRGDGTVYRQKGSRFWWIQYFVDGERRRESTKTENEKLAWRILRMKLSAIDSGDISKGSVDRLATLYQALERDYTINRRKDLRNLKMRWTRHLEPWFAEKLVSEVTAGTISQYIQARQAEPRGGAPASNATINRELQIVKRMFKLAVRNGRLKVGQQPFVEMLQERNTRKGFLKDSEYQALARETAKRGLWLRAMFEVAYTYGWRAGELVGPHGLRVRQVDLEERTIMLNPGETKNEQARSAPMTDRVRELLVACISGKQADDYVFTRESDARGRRPRSRYIEDYRDAWQASCVDAGLGKMLCPDHGLELEDRAKCPACGEVHESRRKYQGLIFHDLRRTGVRNMRRLGISEKVAMTISGHRTRSVFERYNIVDTADLSEAGRKLNQAAQPAPAAAEVQAAKGAVGRPN